MYDKSYHEQNGDIINFAQFEEGGLVVGGPTQKNFSKILISTLHTFILGSQNSDIGPTNKSNILLITQNYPLNPMATICSLFEMWLPLYMGIPYLFITRTWGGTFLVVPTLADFALRSPQWRAHLDFTKIHSPTVLLKSRSINNP